MKPKSLVQKLCANWRSNGTCAGIEIGKDLRQWIDPEMAWKPCCVNKARCNYFERIIIPTVLKFLDKNYPQLQEMKRAVAQYEVMVEKQKRKEDNAGFETKCRNCNEPFFTVAKNRIYCDHCREYKKQTAWRNHKRKSRCSAERVQVC